MIWFSADLHLSHSKIIKFCDRPFSSVEEMDQHLIEEWNRCVSSTDTIYFLGDFAFAGQKRVAELLNSLNGLKHIIWGNHDKTLKKLLREQKLVESQQDYLEIKVDRQPIVLFHYPLRTWNKAYHGSWHLYGHCHGKAPPLGKSVDVGVDAKELTCEYRPVNLDEIREFMEKQCSGC